MKKLLILLFPSTCFAQFSDLSLCENKQTMLGIDFYSNCVGVADASVQKLKSEITAKQLYDYITLSIKDVSVLEEHLSDDMIGRVHALISIDPNPLYYTTVGNNVLVKTKEGLNIFEKHDGYWLQKLVSERSGR
ncbi:MULTISPECIES: hypothetical protein [unclassified Pseudoalteromonas]|uniref:hypothetical protein n=1 Tax=unclassified Pseudoalteromonas TaxID=194690 RepID=UPI0002316153|nr:MULTISPECIES: hypothetical protein [unclassified Pseudoalteromonas]MDQ2043397.1 hypothetical protein [Pseudoalteromonas sp. 20-92]GAA80153.1 hypothetical protein P20495_2665 [Pseudoalteromonas sp. BSi20495]